MSDLDVRRYERALERDGHNPRAVAASLLGTDPARFLLLIRARRSGSSEPPHLTDDKVREAFSDRQIASFRKVTGVTAKSPSSEEWRALWAVPVVTLEDVEAPLRSLGDAYWCATVWDVRARRAAAFWTGSEIECDRVEDGWREVPNGPETTEGQNGFGVTGSNFAGPITYDAMPMFRIRREERLNFEFPEPGALEIMRRRVEESIRAQTMRILTESPSHLLGSINDRANEPQGHGTVSRLPLDSHEERCIQCLALVEPRLLSTAGRCPPCASIASGHGL